MRMASSYSARPSYISEPEWSFWFSEEAVEEAIEPFTSEADIRLENQFKYTLARV